MKFANLVPDKKIGNFGWNHQALLGSGAFGQVYFGKQEGTGKCVAIKQMQLKDLQDPYMQQALKNEVDIMKSLNSPNVVGFFDVFQTSSSIYIILEFCNGGDLRSILTKRTFFPEPEAIRLFQDLLNGFKSLVAKNIIHRDMKPENILIHDGVHKLADFGLSRTVSNFNNQMLQTACGTPLYMSPQILKNENYTTKSDIWSLGIIYYEVIYGTTPWPCNSQYELIKNMCSVPVKFPNSKKITGGSKNFIKGCLQIEEKNRTNWDSLFVDKTFSQGGLGRGASFHGTPVAVNNRITKPPVEDDPEFEEFFCDVLKKIQKKIEEKHMTVEEFFSKFDRKSRDMLSPNDFKKLVRSVFTLASSQDCQDIFEEIDFDGNGYISLQEFVDYVMETDFDEPKENPLLDFQRAERVLHKLKDVIYANNISVEQIFSKYNKSQTMELNQNDFHSILVKIDETVGSQEVLYIFKKFDVNNDGKVSLMEFKNMISPNSPQNFNNSPQNFNNPPQNNFNASPQRNDHSPMNQYQQPGNGGFARQGSNNVQGFPQPYGGGFGTPNYGQPQGYQNQSMGHGLTPNAQGILNDLKMRIRSNNINMEQLFQIHNITRTGKLNYMEFINLTTAIGQPYNDYDLNAVFIYLDANRDNKLDLNEIMTLMR